MHKSIRLSVVLAGLLPLASGCGAPLESQSVDASPQSTRSAEALVAAAWTPSAPMLTARNNASAVAVLDSGLVLVAGGYRDTGKGTGEWTPDLSAELYNPYANTWSRTGAMNEVRGSPGVVRLASGKVLVAGGANTVTPGIRTAELYDPATGTWSYTGSLRTGRHSFTTTLLDSGKVLVTGGMDATHGFTPTAEVYDPATGTWSDTGPTQTASGFFQTATRLYSGEVLLAGNIASETRSAELYNPQTNSWRLVAPVPARRYGHQATRLYSGKVLLTGGGGGQGATSTAYLYDPFLDSWSPVADMTEPREQAHTMTLLYSGKVLVTGHGSAEIFDPATNAWTREQDALVAGNGPVPALLHTGQVLLVGESISRYTP